MPHTLNSQINKRRRVFDSSGKWVDTVPIKINSNNEENVPTSVGRTTGRISY